MLGILKGAYVAGSEGSKGRALGDEFKRQGEPGQ